MKPIKGALLGAAGLAMAATAVKAAKYVPAKKDFGEATEEKVDEKRALEHLSKAISMRLYHPVKIIDLYPTLVIGHPDFITFLNVSCITNRV